MRKFLFAVLVAFLGFAPAHADKMVNVEYIHKLIEQRWDISIPYSPKLSTPKVAANMKYLLTLVDMTNKRINGVATTHYGDGEFATMAAADTIAANRAITKLAKIQPKFTITTTPDTTEFTFRMSAKGRFMVDWGDNTATQIVRDDIDNLETYTHKYKKPGAYKIKMTGQATGYTYRYSHPAIRFGVPEATSESTPPPNTTIAGINGSLGAIFPTIGDGATRAQQPNFADLFAKCPELGGTIPENLFAGIHGAPTASMFARLFTNCEKLSGDIPAGLFAGITGEPTPNLFASTFAGCSNLSGPIPATLFAGLKGTPASAMFKGTFYGCKNLSGDIPDGLFTGIEGTPARMMYQAVFSGCRNLTGKIPVGLFGKISGAPAEYMFYGALHGCNNLTGHIPSDIFGRISGAPAAFMFADVFANCENLTGEIPAGLFGTLYGAPAERMFETTFQGCSGLTGEIPADLFGNISGAPTNAMFNATFYGCKNLSGPSAKINGVPLYNVWPDATGAQVSNCYYGARGLSDYKEIPDAWKQSATTTDQSTDAD